MQDLVGRTLSHYRITAAIGAGGMGEVYRATDTTLGRDVAIKVLPPAVARDAERLSRFRREAHLLASLNHPHIAAIYGLQEADGTPFLALELVDGEELRERLARGPIPVAEALEIAEQIAEALEEAHQKGIIHRDLKPANVKLTPDGRVKVLDFGLAKAWATDVADGSSSSAMLSQSPTFAQTGTLGGLVLGTAAYMSPEQARGKPVDRRTDVWAFGVVLWEMLSGRALFAGGTVTDVIAAVVTQEPSLDTLPESTPPAIRRLLSRCLRKDPRTRLPDIGAARLELQDVIAGTTVDPVAPAVVEQATRAQLQRHRRERWAWAGLSVVALGLAGLLAFLHLRETEPPSGAAARFAVDAPDGWLWPTESDIHWPAPSPDGRHVVFVASRADGAQDATSMLWLRPLESLTARPLAGTEGGFQPMWSPDGRSVAFFTARELRRLDLAAGTVQRICNLPATVVTAGDWSPSGTILFAAGGNNAVIYAVAASGGEPRALTTLDTARGESNHHFPQSLPDGRRFLFLVGGDEGVNGLYVSSLDAPGERQLIAPGWVRRVYAAGHLLSAADGTLVAQPLDLRNMTLRGDRVPLAPSVATWPLNRAFGWFGVSPGGTVGYLSAGGGGSQLQLAWRDRKGDPIGTLGTPANFGQIALSPDERTVAVEIPDAGGQYDIWALDVARGVASRVTSGPGNKRDPVWAPDGRSIAFIARTDKGAELRRKGLRASDAETVVASSELEEVPEYWLPSGDALLTLRRDPRRDEQSVWLLPLGGGDPEAVLTGSRLDEPQLSPDGRWLAYVSSEAGTDDVYIEPFRREGDRVRVSVAGGGQPKWRHDGRELYFVSLANRLMAVDVRAAGERLDVSLPVELFELYGIQGTGLDDYAPSGDGQRFLVKVPVGEDRRPALHVLTNWTSLVR
jgi:eukaryotic-like serine/threonine-protein kinase